MKALDLKKRLAKIEQHTAPLENDGMVEMFLTDSLECVGYRYMGLSYERKEDIPIQDPDGVIFYPIPVEAGNV